MGSKTNQELMCASVCSDENAHNGFEKDCNVQLCISEFGEIINVFFIQVSIIFHYLSYTELRGVELYPSCHWARGQVHLMERSLGLTHNHTQQLTEPNLYDLTFFLCDRILLCVSCMLRHDNKHTCCLFLSVASVSLCRVQIITATEGSQWDLCVTYTFLAQGI